MKFAIVFAALCAAALAAPPQDAVTLRLNADIQPENYNYGYETSNGIQFQEQGQVEDVGTEDVAIVVRGSYSYVGDDGVTYQVNYIADKNGFQPQGAHIPSA